MKPANSHHRLKSLRAFAKDKSGGAAIVMAVAMPIVLGGLAFGSEVAFWEFEKRGLQNEADTAAFAAGTQVRSGNDSEDITAAAVYVAEESGFEGGEDNVVVEYPPATAPLTAGGVDPNGDASYVYVTLNETVERRFTKFFATNSSINFSASAIAKVESGRPACVLALHPSASGAISTGGSTDVELSGCDIAANSISSSAITAIGNGSSVEAECISAVGDVAVNNTYDLECPEPIANGPVTADPYKNVAIPASSSCTSNHNFNQFPNQGSGSIRCYSGSTAGVTVGSNATLDSDTVYVFRNTGTTKLNWTISGNKAVSGTRVTLIFEGKWEIKMNGTSDLSLTPQTTGTYKGIAIFGDRNSEVDIDLSGNNDGKVVGAIYSANRDSHIKYTGSSVAYSTGECTQVIGGTVEFSGNSDFSTNCSASGTTAILSGQSIKIVG